MAAELNHSKVSSFDLEIMGQYQECYKRAQNIKSIPDVDLELRAKAYRSYLMSYYKLKTDLKLIWADSLLDPRHSVMIEARLKMARLKELNRDVKTL
ncbi:MAG: hypothetical protein K2P51_08930, partial [Rhabdochlamydiaceae bacterium]|nr:hypothetical protein [Rhabdochlamydiaceae bacterium]